MLGDEAVEVVRRPAEQRLLATAVRAGALLVGTLPLGLGALFGGGLAAFMAWVVVLGGVGLCLFAVERRDAAGPEVALRAYLAVVGALLLVPLAWLATDHPGDPRAAIAALGHAASRLRPPLGLGLLALAFTPFAFVYLYVRAATTRAWSQALSLLVAGAPLALVFAGGLHSAWVGWLWLLGGPGAAVAVAEADVWLRSRDPRAPAPREDRPPGRVAAVVVATVVLSVLLGGVAVLPVLIRGHRHPNSAAALGSLKTLSTAQSMFREGDKDGDEVFDYAGNLGELGERGLIDSVLASGRRRGYLFRLVHGAEEPEFLWAATAEPVVPHATGSRWFFTNHQGVMWCSDEGPARFDPRTCELEADPAWRPVGK